DAGVRVLIPEDLRIDYIGHYKPFAIGSAVAVFLSLIALPILGVRLRLEVVGGGETRGHGGGGRADRGGGGPERPPGAQLDGANLKHSLVFGPADVGERPSVVGAGGGDAEELPVLAKKIGETLSAAIPNLDVQRSDVVGPRVGQEFRRQAWLSIFLSIAGI